MFNPRISADWSTTKAIAAFSCTQRVQEEHTKAEVEQRTLGLLGLGVILKCHAEKCIAKHMIDRRISSDWSTNKPIAAFSCTYVYKKYIRNLTSYTLPLVSKA